MLNRHASISPKNFILIRMWPPRYRDKIVSYPKIMTKSFLHKPGGNVGHVSVSIFNDNKESYVSHWPAVSPSMFSAVKGANNTLFGDLVGENSHFPTAYIALYSLDTDKMIKRFNEITEKAPWFMFGSKKGSKTSSVTAYSCSSYVYDILTAGGLFDHLLTDKERLKEPITPIQIAELAKKAEKVEKALYLNTYRFLDEHLKVFKNELLEKAKEGPSATTEFLLQKPDYLNLYEIYFPSDFQKLETNLNKNLLEGIPKETIKNSEKLLHVTMSLKNLTKKTDPNERTKTQIINNTILPKFDELLEEKYVDLSQRNDKGYNALHHAILIGNQYCVSKLLNKFPGEVNAEIVSNLVMGEKQVTAANTGLFSSNQLNDIPPLTPLDLAIDTKNEAIINLLKQKGGVAKARTIMQVQNEEKIPMR